MSAYPVLYDADYVEPRSRLTTFFRALLVIPHAIVAVAVGIVLFFTVIGAWFAVVLTGRYPQGLYDVNAGGVRWLSRVSAYAYLQVDAFPPFGFDDVESYPLRVRFAGPLPRYSRLKALFRIVLAIPILVALYVVQLGYQLCAIAAWVVGVLLGRQPRGLFDALDFTLSFQAKATAYLTLLTETYPPFSNEGATLEPVGPAATIETGGGSFAPPGSSLRTDAPGGREG